MISDGVESESFGPCDPWSVANILWTTANGLIRSEHVESAGRLRARPLGEVFDQMVEIFVTGLSR